MYFGPNVPFLKSFLVASAGFQNYSDLVVTATNLKSLAFLDHWMSQMASVPAETLTIAFFLLILKMLML